MGTQSHKILLLVLTGLLLLSVLSGCGSKQLTEEQVKEETLDHLSSRYSAQFTITQAEEQVVGAGPIPNFWSKSAYWSLTAVSSQFPDETFTVVRTTSGTWHDNYYSLLLNDEAIAMVDGIIQDKMPVDYYIYVEWGLDDWPGETGEETTFQEWIKAGGMIQKIIVYLREYEPDDHISEILAEEIHQEIPTVQFVVFMGISEEGFTSIISDIQSFKISNISILKRLSYNWFEEDTE